MIFTSTKNLRAGRTTRRAIQTIMGDAASCGSEVDMGDKFDFSVVGPTGLGLHLTINPQKQPKITTNSSARADIPDDDISVRELYMRHGLTLGDKELRALKLSRPQGIYAIDTMLQHLPGFA